MTTAIVITVQKSISAQSILTLPAVDNSAATVSQPPTQNPLPVVLFRTFFALHRIRATLLNSLIRPRVETHQFGQNR